MSDNVKGPLRSPAKRISHFHRNRRSIKEQSAKTDLTQISYALQEVNTTTGRLVVTQFPMAEVMLHVLRIFGEEKLFARDLEG
jgi:hypothetical protein